MRARGSSLLPPPLLSLDLPDRGDCTPSPRIPRADEGGNESHGGTEVNYQIDVRPQPTTSSPASLVKPTPNTWTRPRARLLSRRIGNNFVAVMRPESMISSPTARRRTKTQSFRKHDYRERLMVIRRRYLEFTQNNWKSQVSMIQKR